MSYVYANRKRTDAKKQETEAKLPSLSALYAGAAFKADEQLGHRVDLPDAIREKMENAFGADLSAVRLYESQAVKDAGANAVTQGNSIAFAPGMLDFSSYGGQALLGHEISHVVSQARGEVQGSGFLNDSSLEARADREGAAAAAGKTVEMPAYAMSSVSAASAAGPMQAKKQLKMGDQEDEDGLELEDLSEEPEESEKPKAPKKKPKSNGAFEALIKGLVDQNDKISSITDPLSDLNDTAKPITDRMKTAQSVEKTVGKMLGVKSMENGSFTGNINSGLKNAVKNVQDTGIESFAETIGDISSEVSNFASVPQSLMKLGDAYDNLDKSKEYGTKQDEKDAKLDLATAGLGVVKKNYSLGSAVSRHFITSATENASSLPDRIDSYISGISLFKNANHMRESYNRKNSMAQSARALKNRTNGEMSEDEKEKLAIFLQGKRSAKLDNKQATFNAVSDALGLSSTVLTMLGASPASTFFSGAQTAVDIVGNETMGYENNKFLKKTVEEKYHAKEKYNKALAEDKTFREFGASRHAFKRKFLEAMGSVSGSKKEAFRKITDERADKLMEGIRKNEDWAIRFANDAGIKHENVGKSEDHDKAVRSSLMKALNGSAYDDDDDKDDEEFHSFDARKYNAFKEGADKKREADADTRSFGEKLRDKYASFKESAGDFMANSWESVKTGGKKALSGIKRTANGAWTIMKSGWGKAKELATSSEARSEAWRNIKTGAGNALDKVGTGILKFGKLLGNGASKAYNGAKEFITDPDSRRRTLDNIKTAVGEKLNYATDVVAHSVKSRAHRVRDWYREGVDQLNENGSTYNQMGLWDRFLWSAKNLPARMTHGLMQNRIATMKRMKENENAEAAVAYLLQKEQNK